MGNIVRLVDGHLVYDGMLSSKEKATIDDGKAKFSRKGYFEPFGSN